MPTYFFCWGGGLNINENIICVAKTGVRLWAIFVIKKKWQDFVYLVNKDGDNKKRTPLISMLVKFRMSYSGKPQKKLFSSLCICIYFFLSSAQKTSFCKPIVNLQLFCDTVWVPYFLKTTTGENLIIWITIEDLRGKCC